MFYMVLDRKFQVSLRNCAKPTLLFVQIKISTNNNVAYVLEIHASRKCAEP